MKDPKYNTNLYNHKDISDNGKPLLGNKELADLMIHIRAGDHGAYYEAKTKFSIEPKQEKLILDIIENRIL